MRRLAVWVVWSGVVALSAVGCSDDGREPRPRRGSGEGGRRQAQPIDGDAPSRAGEAPSAGGEGGAALAPPGGEATGGAPSPASKTVSGVVHAGWSAFPSVVVRLNEREVTTAADGSFTFEDAPEEYQLLLYVPDYRYVRVYDGVRTRLPVIDLGSGEPPTETQEATIQGKAFGGVPPPIPPDCWTEALYVSRTRGHLQSFPFSPPEPFELDLRWGGESDTDDGEVLVLQTVRVPGEAVSQYTGYGKRAVRVSDGMLLGSLSGSPLTDVTLEDPEEYAVTGELSLPEGLTLGGDMLRVGVWRTPTLLSVGDYALTLPDVPEPKAVQLELYGEVGYVRRSWALPGAAERLDLVVPALPELEATPTIAPDTELAWRGLPDQSVALVWMKVGDFTLERVTSASSSRPVDVSVLGVTLPAGAPGTWSVQAIGPAATVDDALVVLRDSSLQAPTSWFSLESASREFQLAP